MALTIQLGLAAWGAAISSILALIKGYEFFHDRPRLKLSAHIRYLSASEEGESYGVKVQIQTGPDLLWNEARVNFRITNAGNKAIQVVSVYVEKQKSIVEITPPNLPVVLQPNMQVVVDLQPEFFHGDIVSTGVYDALGKKHSLPKALLNKIIAEIEDLPLRVNKYKHKESGQIVEAFYMPGRDRIEIISTDGRRRTNG